MPTGTNINSDTLHEELGLLLERLAAAVAMAEAQVEAIASFHIGNHMAARIEKAIARGQLLATAEVLCQEDAALVCGRISTQTLDVLERRTDAAGKRIVNRYPIGDRPMYLRSELIEAVKACPKAKV